MKDILLVISLLLAIGLSVFVIRFAEKADKAGKSLEEERYSRMVAEETLQKNDAKLTTLQQAVKEDQNKMAKIEDILDQEKNVNSDLKKQYDELTQAKANLEAKLQSVLQEKAQAAAQAAEALKELGIACVIARSFGNIFYRNALNFGLPVLVCPTWSGIQNGDVLDVDPRSGLIENLAQKTGFSAQPLPDFLLEMIDNGGLVPHLEKRFARVRQNMTGKTEP